MSETFVIFEIKKFMFKSIKCHIKNHTALFHDYAITLSHKHADTMPFVCRTKTSYCDRSTFYIFSYNMSANPPYTLNVD